MANVLGELFQSIADAIRSKTGSTDTLKPNQFPAAIEGITAGGGGSSADVRYVTFRNESTGEEFVKPVAYGDDCVDVVAKGLWKKPTKESTAQYNYTFYGWGASDGGAADANILKNITEDKTVYAIFAATVRMYTITWLDSDGVTELPGQKQWAYGSVPSYTPTKDGYAFDKWTPTPTAVTGDASYTATWVEIIGGSLGDNCTWQLDAGTGVLTVSGTGAMPTNYTWYGPYSPIYDVKDSVTEVVIEDGVTSIGNAVFYQCANLERVTIPNSVTLIGKYAFRGCTSLSAVEIPDTVTEVDTGAFYEAGLTSIKIPAVSSIPDAICDSCKNLVEIVFHEKNLRIGEQAFQDCTSLTNVTIPIGIVRIGKRAFKGCTNLTTVVTEHTGNWKVTSDKWGDSTVDTVSLNNGNGATYLTTTYAERYFHKM